MFQSKIAQAAASDRERYEEAERRRLRALHGLDSSTHARMAGSPCQPTAEAMRLLELAAKAASMTMCELTEALSLTGVVLTAIRPESLAPAAPRPKGFD